MATLSTSCLWSRKLCAVSSFTKCLVLWFAIHYIFHLGYSHEIHDIALFIQEFVFGLPQCKGGKQKTSSYLTISSDIQSFSYVSKHSHMQSCFIFLVILCMLSAITYFIHVHVHMCKSLNHCYYMLTMFMIVLTSKFVDLIRVYSVND